MKYLFILGRNRDLSVAEIEAYLKREGNSVEKKANVENGLLVWVDLPIKDNAIDVLGGTISIGEVLAEGEGNEIFGKIDSIEIYNGSSNKLNYTLWDFSGYYDEALDYLKNRFKGEKLKATHKGLTGKIKTQSGGVEFKPSSKLLDCEYFIFEENGVNYFGKIVQKCDYEDIERRDMEKPVRRESLAIAPRLAKILINLSGARQGDVLFDPFCGIGVVLEEALRQGIDVVGVDLDPLAIDGARKNLEWFGFDKNRYKLFNHDSKKVGLPEIECIATEPDLGDVLKKIPTKEKAEKTLRRFEKLMIGVINNAKGRVLGRIVFTSPYIRIGKKRLGCDIEKICKKTGYELEIEPIAEYRKNQIVGRLIYVLKKRG